MLSHIFVKDLVIVSTLELDLGDGMTTLTGETGAGKSILIDALGLSLGDKADPSLVRNGCERAEIIAGFALDPCSPATDWLREQGLDDQNECILRRLVAAKGRSRAFINGRPATTNQLQGLGQLLVDIHGQHAHQSLLRNAQQRDLLDAYGGQGALAEQVAESFRRFRAIDERLAEMRATSNDRADRLELLRYQIDELTALGLTAAEIDELDREQKRLSNLGRLQETTGTLLHQLYEAEPSLHDQLRHAGSAIEELTAIDPCLGETRELLDGSAIQLEEAASNLRAYLDGLELDPARVNEVDAKIAQLHDLARKYRVLPRELPDRLEQLTEELRALEQADVALDGFAQDQAKARTDYLAVTAKLSKARTTAAAKLGKVVTESMQQLSMTGGRFQIALEQLDEDAAGPYGLDRIELLVSANPGQPLQPLAKAASGGELSRISLAIQVATAECGSIPTLIFDEVDVGIGGGVAEIVGRLLRRLGTSRQILCVTHLPQVASQAHQQLRVKKQTRKGQTFTHIQPLDDTERVEEIARMLGGTEITETTRAHAEEMLRNGSKTS